MYAQNCVMRRSCASFLAIAILTFGLLPLVGAQAQQDTRRSKTAGASEVAQQPRKFVPGELLVGYKTEADRDKATKALTAQRKKFILPGGKKARRLTVTPMSGAAMSVRIELPRSIRAAAKKDPAVELKILQETAETLRQANERITYAHPNWMVPMAGPRGAKPVGTRAKVAQRRGAAIRDATIAAPRTLQEEKPFGGPPPKTISPDERDTTMAGPRGAEPAGTRTKDARKAGAPMRASGRNRGDLKGFDGQWQMADGGALEIEGKEWHHPALGIADLFKPEGSANYEVQYRYHRGATCTYRIKKTSDGQRLILEPADPTQPVDFCPSGTLPKVGS